MYQNFCINKKHAYLTSVVIFKLFSLFSITVMLSWNDSWNKKQNILSAKSGITVKSYKNLQLQNIKKQLIQVTSSYHEFQLSLFCQMQKLLSNMKTLTASHMSNPKVLFNVKSREFYQNDGNL